MPNNKFEAEATILSVKDDGWKYSLEADIPAFDGDRPYRFIGWNKKQGPPPQKGTTGVGTFEAYKRSKFYIERGDVEDGPVDGTETHYHVTWNMVAFSSGSAEATNGTEAQSPIPAAKAPVRASSQAPASSGAVHLPTPTSDERLAKELAKFRRESEGINDRKAVSDVLAMVEAGAYTLDGLIEDATKLAAWYNTRMAARCGASPLVESAQDSGAVVTNVEEKPEAYVEPKSGAPTVKNLAELQEWVTSQMWRKDSVSETLQDAGFASSAAYLQKPGNTVQGLAELLHERLSW